MTQPNIAIVEEHGIFSLQKENGLFWSNTNTWEPEGRTTWFTGRKKDAETLKDVLEELERNWVLTN